MRTASPEEIRWAFAIEIVAQGAYGASSGPITWGECLGCGYWCPEALPEVQCDALPPDCPQGQIPEAGDGCWTGACVPCPADQAACDPGESAGPVLAMGCGEPAPREDLPLLCEDVEPCEHNGDCVVTNADPCCGMAQIAVLATRVDEVADAVGDCDIVNPLCLECAVREGAAICTDGRCELVGAGLADQ